MALPRMRSKTGVYMRCNHCGCSNPPAVLDCEYCLKPIAGMPQDLVSEVTTPTVEHAPVIVDARDQWGEVGEFGAGSVVNASTQNFVDDILASVSTGGVRPSVLPAPVSVERFEEPIEPESMPTWQRVLSFGAMPILLMVNLGFIPGLMVSAVWVAAFLIILRPKERATPTPDWWKSLQQMILADFQVARMDAEYLYILRSDGDHVVVRCARNQVGERVVATGLERLGNGLVMTQLLQAVTASWLAAQIAAMGGLRRV